MISVGCRSTNALRRELNSEYLRATSISCRYVSDHCCMSTGTRSYSCSNLINDIAPVGALASVCDQDFEVWVLVE